MTTEAPPPPLLSPGTRCPPASARSSSWAADPTPSCLPGDLPLPLHSDLSSMPSCSSPGFASHYARARPRHRSPGRSSVGSPRRPHSPSLPGPRQHPTRLPRPPSAPLGFAGPQRHAPSPSPSDLSGGSFSLRDALPGHLQRLLPQVTSWRLHPAPQLQHNSDSLSSERPELRVPVLSGHVPLLEVHHVSHRNSSPWPSSPCTSTPPSLPPSPSPGVTPSPPSSSPYPSTH